LNLTLALISGLGLGFETPGLVNIPVEMKDVGCGETERIAERPGEATAHRHHYSGCDAAATAPTRYLQSFVQIALFFAGANAHCLPACI